MRTRWMVLPVLALAICGAVSADDSWEIAAGPAVSADLNPMPIGPAGWRTAPDQLDYLRYPGRCRGAPGCGVSVVSPAADQRWLDGDYIDALNLVTYGDMNVKFTGKRIKLKFRF